MYREKRIAELMGVGRDDLIEYVLRLEEKIGGPLLTNDNMRYDGNKVHSLDCLNSESDKCIPECPKFKS